MLFSPYADPSIHMVQKEMKLFSPNDLFSSSIAVVLLLIWDVVAMPACQQGYPCPLTAAKPQTKQGTRMLHVEVRLMETVLHWWVSCSAVACWCRANNLATRHSSCVADLWALLLDVCSRLFYSWYTLATAARGHPTSTVVFEGTPFQVPTIWPLLKSLLSARFSMTADLLLHT